MTVFVYQKKTLFLSVLILFTVLKSFSEDKYFDKIDMTTGLSNNTALCLLEDHEGYIWIGTRDGLNKYNGVHFEVFKHIFEDSASLVNNQVNCLLETENQEIWMGTANGLSMYDTQIKRFRTFDLLRDESTLSRIFVRTIFETHDKKLWVGTTRGLFIIDKERKQSKWVLVHPDITQEANGIRNVFEDTKGNIWVGTNDGLYKSENDHFRKCQFETETKTKPNIVRVIKEDQAGLLWIGTENNGLIILDTGKDSIQVVKHFHIGNSQLLSNIVRSIHFQSEKLAWIGTFGGLSILNTDNNTIENHTDTNKKHGGISQNSIRDVISDSMGGIWVATYLGGVNYCNNQKNLFAFKTWTDANNESNSNIVSALIEDKNDLWIGTEGGGLFLSKDGGKTINRRFNDQNSKLPHNSIKTLELGQNELWVGTLEGLSRIDRGTNRITNFVHKPGDDNSLIPGHITALFYENPEEIWIGSNGGGVQMFNLRTLKFTSLEKLTNANITCFYPDSKGYLWIGKENKLFLFNINENRLEDIESKVKNWENAFSYISFVSEDSQNNIWIGTLGNGLYMIKDNYLFWFNTSSGLNDNSVNSLLEGDTNQYWITTNKGLSRIDMFEKNDGQPVINSHSYSVKQGLQGLQFSPNCAMKSHTGELYFGGINGINSFRHEKILDLDFYPKLVLEELRIDYQKIVPAADESPLQKSINATQQLKLNYNQRDFSLSFTGINFINPDKNQYRYMVSGIDDSWVEMGNQSNINFTYFPVGTYEIKIQVSTNPDKWDTNYKSILVTVLPPWWKTWWAFLIYSAALGMMLTLFFILSQRWAKMKNQLLMQHFQREKENELHQLKLKFYTDVSHELRTPLTLILAPLENLISKSELPNRFRNQLTQIQRSGFRLMQLVNQILDLRKLETGHENLQVAEGNIIRFFSEISLAFKEVANAKNITFEFLPYKQELSLWYDRDKLEIIVNNLLSNAFKFTPSGGKVELQLNEISGQDITEEFIGLNQKNSYLQIKVVDNGEGINPEDFKNIYKRFFSKKEKGQQQVPNAGVGLELTKRMVELHKGGISVSSGANEADKTETEFSIYLSLDNNVYTREELDLEFKNSEDRSLYTNELLQRETDMVVSEEEEEDKLHPHREEEFERLLIVEDNAEVRSFIKELFIDDYEISEAENGETGLQKAIETNPQLIISDVMMPVMDGIELCRRIKTDPRTSHIPVVLLTARTALTFKYEGLETGADDYITKPFSARYLLLRVKNLIKQRKSIQEHFKREAICDPGSITLTSVDEKILKKAMDYIIENMANPSISVTKISAHVGLSRVHFYRKMKALTNQTAVEFIRNVRLKRAATLLSQNKLSVKEVRNMVGFEDANYFRDCFKEQFGVTPSDYTESKS
jgi:ligand-binding sensor domain-containing protein/signal transduction histidine kinase/CheY-like chemotaxis protein/AraC-like DNA-binding protein